MMNVLTGFKFIAEQIQHDEETGRPYIHVRFQKKVTDTLVKSFVRDKDAVQAVLLLYRSSSNHFKNEGKDFI